MAILILISTLIVGGLCANSITDRVVSLPDCGPIPSPMYSGYLNVSDTRALYYVLQESLDDPSKDPLVIWFNGGPGCSSLSDFFVQHGPFIFDDG